MRRLAPAVLLWVLLQQAGAAPAPPARLATAEAVFALWEGTGRTTAEWLHSGHGLYTIAFSKGGWELGCVRREDRPVLWLATRLKVAVDEKRRTVIIRVEGCPKKDALPLLLAAVEAYKGGTFQRQEAELRQLRREHELLLQRLVLYRQRAAGNPPQPMLDETRRVESQIRALETKLKNFVIEPPHLVPDGR